VVYTVGEAVTGPGGKGKAAPSSLMSRLGLGRAEWTTDGSEDVKSTVETMVDRAGRPACLSLLSVSEVALYGDWLIDDDGGTAASRDPGPRGELGAVEVKRDFGILEDLLGA
jgi:hypothetical protein